MHTWELCTNVKNEINAISKHYSQIAALSLTRQNIIIKLSNEEKFWNFQAVAAVGGSIFFIFPIISMTRAVVLS